MGRLTLFVLTGVVVLFVAAGFAALYLGKCTWQEFIAFVMLAATALWTYIRAEPKEVQK
jgi:hypothetical protein